MKLLKLGISFLLLSFILNLNLIGSFFYNEDIYTIKNDENFELNNYTPFKIHFDLSNLNVKRKDNKMKQLKQSIIKSGKIFNQLLKTNEKFNISSNYNLERICNLEELKGFKLNTSSIDLIIIVVFQDLKKNAISNSTICIFHPKNKRPLLSILYLSKNILSITKEEQITTITNRILFILGFDFFTKSERKMGNYVQSYNNFQLKRAYYKYNGYSSKGYMFFLNVYNKQLIGNVAYKDWNKNIYEGIMADSKRRTLVFNEFVLRYLQNLNYYSVNMDLCGCTLNGNCSIDFLPYEIYVSLKSNLLYCMKNDVYNKKCLITNYIPININDKKFPNIKSKKQRNYFISDKCLNENFNSEGINQNLLYLNQLKKTYQELELISPKYDKFCKCYPKTVFFKNKMQKSRNEEIYTNFKITNKNITDSKYIVYSFITNYRNNHVITMKKVLNWSKIPILKYSFNPNFLFYEAEDNFNIETISNINKYTVYRAILKGTHIGPKDEAYYLYLQMKKKFPNDYNFMFESYFMPKEEDKIIKKFKNYNLTEDNLWLCKESFGSLGIGIKILKTYDNFINCKGIISRYLHNPHLYNKKKYHLRIYIVQTSIIPLKIYIYNEAKVIRASRNYQSNLTKIDNRKSFITNNAVNYGKKGYKGDILTNKLEEIIEKEGGNWDEIWNKIEDLSIKLIISNYENDYNQMKYFKLNNGIIFRYYGIDVLIDDSFKPWLLEANRYPYMHLNDKVNKINKIGFTTDLLNLLGIIPYNHDNGNLLEDEVKCNFKNDIEEMINNAFCEFNRPQGKLKRIFPVKETLNNYKKFFSNPGDENLALWKAIEE